MTTVHISNFAGAQEALKHPDLVQALYDAGGIVMDDVLLTLHGEAHRKRRLAAFRVFNRGFFRHYEQRIFPEALEEALAPCIEAGEADLIEFGYRVTMNLTADFAGIDRDRTSPAQTLLLLKLVKTFSEGATLVHSTRDHNTVRSEVSEALDTFEQTFLAPSRARRLGLLEKSEKGLIQEDALPRDIMTVLLQQRQALALAEDVFRREIAFYLQAGAHSTANSMVHAMHELLSWCAAYPEARQALLQDNQFLQRCVHESFRLHPASPVAWRRARRPVQLSHAPPAAAGDAVVIDLEQANRDPAVFGEDADHFNPDRKLHPSTRPFGLTFGYGAHSCLGRDLDGGVVTKAGVVPERKQLGIVSLLVDALLRLGARWQPNNPPTADPSTERGNWARYPVVLSRT